jgi:hypothetical protein
MGCRLRALAAPGSGQGSAEQEAAAACSSWLASALQSSLLLEQPLGGCMAAAHLLELRAQLQACAEAATTTSTPVAADGAPRTPAPAAASAGAKSASKKSARKAAKEAVGDEGPAAGLAKVLKTLQAAAEGCLQEGSSAVGLGSKQRKHLLQEMQRQAGAAGGPSAAAAGGRRTPLPQQALLAAALEDVAALAAQPMPLALQQQLSAAALCSAVALAGVLLAEGPAGTSAPAPGAELHQDEQLISSLLTALQLMPSSTSASPWRQLLADGAEGSGSGSTAGIKWLQGLWRLAPAAGASSSQLQQLAAALLELAPGCQLHISSQAEAALQEAGKQALAAVAVATSALPAALASCSAASWLQAQPQLPLAVRKAAASLASGTLALHRKSLSRLQQAGSSSSKAQLEQLLASACCLAALVSLAASSRGASEQQQEQQEQQAAAGAPLAEALLGGQHCKQLLEAIPAHLAAVHSLVQQRSPAASASASASASGAGWSPELLQLAIPAVALLQQLCHLLPEAGAAAPAAGPLPLQMLELHLQLLRQLVPPSTRVILLPWQAEISWRVLAGPQVERGASCGQRLLLGLLLSLQSLLGACGEGQLQQLHGALLELLQLQGRLDSPAACTLAQALLVALETTPGARRQIRSIRGRRAVLVLLVPRQPAASPGQCSRNW